jgi:predicted RNA-binding Zn-ribbon protein involved in translation (DUF1610 family)
MYHNCGKHSTTKKAEESLRNRRVSVEICHVRSTLKPGEDPNAERCISCEDWLDDVPDGAWADCPHCGAELVVISIKKCPVCKGEFEFEEEEDES